MTLSHITACKKICAKHFIQQKIDPFLYALFLNSEFFSRDLQKILRAKNIADDGIRIGKTRRDPLKRMTLLVAFPGKFLISENQLTYVGQYTIIIRQLNLLLWLSRVDALSKLAGGKFVAKDGAELCSNPGAHFLGKYIHNRGKRHEKAPKERTFALLALCGNEPVKKV